MLFSIYKKIYYVWNLILILYILGEPSVTINNFVETFAPLMKPYVPSVIQRARNVKRIGVLISGTGTNLQVSKNKQPTSPFFFFFEEYYRCG